jgi:proline utilization trans-activator
MEQQQATFTFDYSSQNIPGGTSGNVVQNWFQKDPVDLPWELKDFFGTEGFIGGSTTSVAGQPFQGIPMSLAGSYASNIVPMIDEEALAAPVPPHNAYNPHWGAVEAPYVPHNRNGSLPRGSRLH